MANNNIDLASKIRNVPDYPVKGIQFKDITTLLRDKEGLKESVDRMVEAYKGKDIDIVVGIESRGFIYGTVVAYLLGLGFVPIRKPSKLPADVYRVNYQLEYGMDSIEMHKDAFEEGAKVLIVDDLLATGGTALASAQLVEKAGGIVDSFAFVIELTGSLKGRKRIEAENYKVFSEVKLEVNE